MLKLNRDFFVINYKTNLDKISLSARIIVLSPNRYNSMKPFIDHQKFMESFSLKKKYLYCNLPCTIALYNWQIVFNCIVMGIDFKKSTLALIVTCITFNVVNLLIFNIQWVITLVYTCIYINN